MLSKPEDCFGSDDVSWDEGNLVQALSDLVGSPPHFPQDDLPGSEDLGIMLGYVLCLFLPPAFLKLVRGNSSSLNVIKGMCYRNWGNWKK